MKTLEKDMTPPLKEPQQALTKKEQKQIKKKEKREGRRIRSLEPINSLMPFLMKSRNGASNLFEAEFDTKAADEYITQKRKEGLKGFSMMHLLIAAYVRTASEYPGINRFVRGQRVMARNKIVIAMNIKRELALDKGETVVKFFPKPDATAEEIYHLVENTIQAAHDNDDTEFDKIIGTIAKLPRPLLRLFVRILYILDYYGMMPRSLVEVSPFHASAYLTSMGSLGIPPVYHHLYDFGNVPLFLSFGSVTKKPHITSNGTVTQKKVFPVRVTCDDRICDGHYYALFFKSVRRYFKKPELLDTPPEKVNEDIP